MSNIETMIQHLQSALGLHRQHSTLQPSHERFLKAMLANLYRALGKEKAA